MKTTKINVANARNKFVFPLAGLLILIFMLVGCSFPSGTESLESNLINQTSTTQTQINFRLSLYEPLNENEKVVLEIIDEVTGIPYNIRRVDMNQVDDLAVTTRLSVPVHSVIKYRYAKIGEEIISEKTLGGEPVRYRLVYADANHTINDVLQTWQDDLAEAAQTGVVEGIILDRSTNLPIPDILVSAGGQLTFSDANGAFSIEGLSSGVHNLVFYALDGHYRTFQQGAVISEGLVTPAEVKMMAMPPVTVTLNVTVPDDALGAPVRIAGNLAQLGNTFTSLAGDMSLMPKRMPTLSAQADGTLKIDLQLYAESDLRFKFTLGDGYWNAESGEFRVRQLIVPDKDTTLDLDITSWRSSAIEPITFEVTIPQENVPDDEKFIQFKTYDWTEPIPLWPLGNGSYLYILYTPLSETEPLEFRFCRNGDCQHGKSLNASDSPMQVQPSTTPQNISTTITGWENWHSHSQENPVVETFIPDKTGAYSTMIELSPTMDPSWRVYAPIGISDIIEMGTGTVLLTPQWFDTAGKPTLKPVIGETPFHYELLGMLNTAQSMGLQVGLFPQPGSHAEQEMLWTAKPQNEAEWQAWFDSYETFLLNYAKIAEQSGSTTLIVGGKSVLPAFIGGFYPDGTETDVPESSEDLWVSLLQELRAAYSGRLIWASNAHEDMDPLPGFINEFDGIYISINSPLTTVEEASIDDIKAGFTQVIDSLIYEVYRSTLKPITVALAYPSLDGAVMGCRMVDAPCSSDGVLIAEETTGTSTDLQEQALIYNAVLPVIASREWITGVAVRGYDPTLNALDSSSSIAGKPAADVIQYWFTGLTTE